MRPPHFLSTGRCLSGPEEARRSPAAAPQFTTERDRRNGSDLAPPRLASGTSTACSKPSWVAARAPRPGAQPGPGDGSALLTLRQEIDRACVKRASRASKSSAWTAARPATTLPCDRHSSAAPPLGRARRTGVQAKFSHPRLARGRTQPADAAESPWEACPVENPPARSALHEPLPPYRATPSGHPRAHALSGLTTCRCGSDPHDHRCHPLHDAW